METWISKINSVPFFGIFISRGVQNRASKESEDNRTVTSRPEQTFSGAGMILFFLDSEDAETASEMRCIWLQ